jgi:pilus assembly protein CpaE
MSLIESLANPTRGTPAHAEFVAFLADAASTETVEQFALSRMMPHTYIRQGSVADATEFMTKLERAPRQLVVDISTSAMALSELAALAEVCPPSVSVVVIGERNDVGLFRELLRMGVDEYISKPLTIDLLTRLLGGPGAVVQPVHQVRTGKLVACVGARGGVGVSTVAANVAWYLAHNVDRRVALLDLDPFGGPLNIMLGTQCNNGLSDVLKNVRRLDPQYLERTMVPAGGKLFVLSAQAALDSGETIDTDSLRELVNELKRHFHYVIVDMPNRAGGSSIAMLEEAQVVALVTEPSVYAARETARLMRTAETRDAHAPVMLIANQPRQPGRGELAMRDFEEAVGRRASHVLPYDHESASKAENLGPPVVASRGALSVALKRVGDDLAGRRLDDKPKRGSFTFRDHPLLRQLLEWRG